MLPDDIPENQKKVLSSYPVRNPVKWRMENKKAVLTYSKNLSGVEKKLMMVLKGPGNIRRPLDAHGTDIWLMCDGEHTILDICKAMDEKYKEQIEPVFKRVGTFIEILLKLNLITLQSGSTKPTSVKIDKHKQGKGKKKKNVAKGKTPKKGAVDRK